MKQSHMTNILSVRGLITLPQLFHTVTNLEIESNHCKWVIA